MRNYNQIIDNGYQNWMKKSGEINEHMKELSKLIKELRKEQSIYLVNSFTNFLLITKWLDTKILKHYTTRNSKMNEFT